MGRHHSFKQVLKPVLAYFTTQNLVTRNLIKETKYSSYWLDLVHSSVAFLPRDAMRNSGIFCRPVSVRLSVTLVHSVHTPEVIVKLLCRPAGSSIILVFWPSSADTQFQGEPLQRRHKIQGVGTFCDFRLKSPSISETVRDRPMDANAMERW